MTVLLGITTESRCQKRQRPTSRAIADRNSKRRIRWIVQLHEFVVGATCPRSRNSLISRFAAVDPAGVTVTVNEHAPPFNPETLTVVVPNGNVEPEGVA
jgi:hypothetical protein